MLFYKTWSGQTADFGGGLVQVDLDAECEHPTRRVT